MAIKCPYCAFPIELKGVRAGHFQPKCPRCAEKFGLVIHPDPAMQPTVTALTDLVKGDVAAALGIKEVKHAPVHATSAPVHAVPTQQSAPRPLEPQPAHHHASNVGATSAPAAPIAPVHGTPSVAPRPASVEASVPHVPEMVPTTESENQDLPAGTSLGGYEVLQKLGSGGMGAVYLARQVSLDRNVALKTLHQQLAKDAQLVSRFTREAYAAAQLTHHNIVQIHDIGQDRSINFFSMEFVSGITLANLLRENGKIDTETAVTYILQAARGLKFAHDHGLIHRDVKPENLLLNDQGIVKVADLGLVKRVGSHETENMQMAQAMSSGVAITQVNKSMGTPLYMPPEQAIDAARVDHRADIYSLGCTLYHLVTGRPPFTGRTAMEVLTKHQHEPLTPPDVVVKDVPPTLTPIVQRMLAKHPEERYPSMKDVISALEGFLGVASSGHFAPKEDQVKILEFSVDQFNQNIWARLKPKVGLAFFAGCALVCVLFAYKGHFNLAGGTIGLAALATIAYQVTQGVMRRTIIFRKLRHLIFGAGFFDWLLWIAGIAIFGYLLYAFDLYWPWLFAGVLGIGLSQAFYWIFDHLAATSREKHLKQADQLIRQMRLKGLDETAIRQFVSKFSGKHWEEFYEAVFGYEEKLQARAIWGKERGKDRPKFAAWRDSLIAYIDHRIESRKQLREAKLLAKLEQKALQAKGIEERLARKQANKNAQRLVSTAEMVKRESEKHVAQTLAPPSSKATSAPSDTPTALSMSTLAMTKIAEGHPHDSKDLDHAPEYVRQSYFRRRYGTPLQFLSGSLVRVGIALALLAMYANWWNMNHAQTALGALNEVVTTHQRDAVDVVADTKINRSTVIEAVEAGKTGPDKPLQVAFLPERWTRSVHPSSVLIAGVLLLLGAGCRGVLLGISMYISAGIAIYGKTINLPLLHENWVIAALAAAGLWAFAVIFLRLRND